MHSTYTSHHCNNLIFRSVSNHLLLMMCEHHAIDKFIHLFRIQEDTTRIRVEKGNVSSIDSVIEVVSLPSCLFGPALVPASN